MAQRHPDVPIGIQSACGPDFGRLVEHWSDSEARKNGGRDIERQRRIKDTTEVAEGHQSEARLGNRPKSGANASRRIVDNPLFLLALRADPGVSMDDTHRGTRPWREKRTLDSVRKASCAGVTKGMSLTNLA
jgi:hypothetical protein